MSQHVREELESLHRFITDLLCRPEEYSPEEAVELWRMANPTTEQLAEDVAAVQEALDDMAAGDKGIPLEDFLRGIRSRHGIPEDT